MDLTGYVHNSLSRPSKCKLAHIWLSAELLMQSSTPQSSQILHLIRSNFPISSYAGFGLHLICSSCSCCAKVSTPLCRFPPLPPLMASLLTQRDDLPCRRRCSLPCAEGGEPPQHPCGGDASRQSIPAPSARRPALGSTSLYVLCRASLIHDQRHGWSPSPLPQVSTRQSMTSVPRPTAAQGRQGHQQRQAGRRRTKEKRGCFLDQDC